MAPLLDPIRDAIERHCASPHQATPIPGLTIFRMTSTTPPDRALYNPRLLLIVQGAKSVALGETLTQFALNSSHVAKIGRVTDWIKHHYAEPMSIEALAELAGMSVTSFHRHFKNLTSMTPIQYRMQIRLREARRMLISEGEGAGAIGLKVGYESQSQFSRDYKRLFGAPPASDTARLANGR